MAAAITPIEVCRRANSGRCDARLLPTRSPMSSPALRSLGRACGVQDYARDQGRVTDGSRSSARAPPFRGGDRRSGARTRPYPCSPNVAYIQMTRRSPFGVWCSWMCLCVVKPGERGLLDRAPGHERRIVVSHGSRAGATLSQPTAAPRASSPTAPTTRLARISAWPSRCALTRVPSPARPRHACTSASPPGSNASASARPTRPSRRPPSRATGVRVASAHCGP
jgi:hypothetical protein